MNTQWQQTIEQTIDNLSKNSPFKDLTDNAKTMLTSALRNLDVVTREEFDVQAAMLVRTREKLEALEKQVAALESLSK
ncbi:MAG: accessory factor UbiK family protein [Formosimonas sp.]|jgi:BMFP domain-containing protein YqiC